MSSQQDNSNQQPLNQDEIGNKNFFPPRRTSAIAMLLKSNPEHHLVKAYLESKEKYDINFNNYINEISQKKKVQEELPELFPLDKESLYKTFKEAYSVFRGIEFNEHLNKKDGWKYGEGAVFARTICAYLLKDKNFYKSPILNKELNEPNLGKGMLIVGEMGTGKTSIIKTFYDMFLYSNTNPIFVQDIHGTNQYLSRYKLGFKFFNCHEVVQDYHSAAREKNKEHEDIFWKKHKSGLSYYDDLMTEKKAFGRDELFTEILETKYNKVCPLITSLNYVGKSTIDPDSNETIHTCDINTTLDALELRYGSRFYDRIFEMFNIIELQGKSLRK